MKSVHRVAIGAAVLLGIITASSAGPPQRGAHARVQSGAAHLMVFGGRSFAQLHSTEAKLDAALADLVRHAYLARPAHVLTDLHAMSPAARFVQRRGNALVAVDAVARGDPQALRAALAAVGLQNPAVYKNDVGGWLPVSAISAATARVEVLSLRAAMPHTRGAVATQGDFAIGTAALRTTYPALSGSGVTVGVLSDSFNCYYVYGQPGSGVPASGAEGYASNGFTADAQQDEASGALPPGADINVLEENGGTAGVIGSQDCLNYGTPTELPFSDEGRAMMQIVHAVAPGANLAFYTADNSEADFAAGIEALANAGAQVEADDVGYYDEPFFQDGLLAQAINSVEAKGVAYFSAAGNDSDLAYDNNSPSFASTKTTLADGNQANLLSFVPNDASATTLGVSLPELVPGEFVAIVLEWNQPYVTGAPGSPGASSELDLCVQTAPGTVLVLDLDGAGVSCTGPNQTGTDPVQILIVGNPANATSYSDPTEIQLSVGLYGGTVPTMIKVAVEDGGAGSTIDSSYGTGGATLQGHPGAAGAAAVGAAAFYSAPSCGTTVAQLEYFSSLGGAPILFNTNGAAITPETRQKPDFVGPDGVNNTFLGFTLAGSGFSDTSTVPECANSPSYPNFFGTSAATPHAAAAAALMLQANPTVTPAQIFANLRSSAAPMGTPPDSPDPGSGVYNFSDGYGFIQAQAAMALLPAGPPVVKVVPTTIALGNSSTLSWLAVNSTACTASGSWNGAQTASGSQVETPVATGTTTYTLTCGTQSASATLNVVSALSAIIITTTSLPGGRVGTAYSTTLTATGGSPPYTWLFASGTLPPGLELNPSTGALSGTPTAGASATPLTFEVTDSETPPKGQAATLALTVIAPLVISTTSLPGGQVGAAYSATLTATGGTSPYGWSITSGSLPAGLSLSSSGAISGTPTTAVSASPITFEVSDSENPAETKTANLSMTISAAPSSGGGGHGGGGALGASMLVALAGFVLARLLRLMPALAPRRVRSRERA
ncbi:MAG: putative Ig domain-containing protein [Steroidobacteraceae bacterium]